MPCEALFAYHQKLRGFCAAVVDLPHTFTAIERNKDNFFRVAFEVDAARIRDLLERSWGDPTNLDPDGRPHRHRHKYIVSWPQVPNQLRQIMRPPGQATEGRALVVARNGFTVTTSDGLGPLPGDVTPEQAAQGALRMLKNDTLDFLGQELAEMQETNPSATEADVIAAYFVP